MEIPSEVWVLFGALVGGMASAYGGHLATKADRNRVTRIEIYRDIFPKVFHENEEALTSPFAYEHWQNLWRAATTVGGKEQKLARQTRRLYDDMDRSLNSANEHRQLDEETGRYHPEPTLYARHIKAKDDLNTMMKEWNARLEEKVG